MMMRACAAAGAGADNIILGEFAGRAHLCVFLGAAAAGRIRQSGRRSSGLHQVRLPAARLRLAGARVPQPHQGMPSVL